MVTKEAVIDAVRMVNDPELMLSIVDLGLVYDVEINNSNQPDTPSQEQIKNKLSKNPKEESNQKAGSDIAVKMTLTSPACPYGPMLIEWTKYAAEKVEGVKQCEIKLVWDPPWDPRTMATEEIKLQLGLL